MKYVYQQLMENKPKRALSQRGVLLFWLQKKESENKQLKRSKAKGCQLRVPTQTNPGRDLSAKPLLERSDEVYTEMAMERIGIASLECFLIHLIHLDVLNDLQGLSVTISVTVLICKNWKSLSLQGDFSLLLQHTTTEPRTKVSLILITTLPIHHDWFQTHVSFSVDQTEKLPPCYWCTR